MRLVLALLIAVVVNFGLFALMQKMIAPESVDLIVTEDIRLLDFVRIKRENKAETKKRELPKKPPPPQKRPPPPQATTPQLNKPKTPTPKLAVPKIDLPLNITGGPYLGDFAITPQLAPVAVPAVIPAMNDEVIPLVRIPPKYPQNASRRGIEGAVTISFMISKDGLVHDPVVVSSDPEDIFDKAALKAIKKWKFKPKLVNGQAVERQATQEIEFKLSR